MRTSGVTICLLALAGCGDPLFFADVEDSRICIARPNETVPGAPAEVAALIGERTVEWAGTFDLGSNVPGLNEKGTRAEIRMGSLRLTSTTDMRSVRSAVLSIPDGKGGAVPLMHYEQPENADPKTIVMALDEDVNLADRLTAGKLRYTIALTGSPPTESWTSDVTACVSARVKIDALAR